MEKKTDTVVEIGKNERVPVKIVENEEQSIVITELDPIGVGLHDCVVQPIKGSDDYDYYNGPCRITPTKERQVLPTDNKVVLENIIVEPIPQNYGLISWNGSTLTVS